MATAFTDKEKEVIRKKLHKAAKECLQRYGVSRSLACRAESSLLASRATSANAGLRLRHCQGSLVLNRFQSLTGLLE